MSLTGGGPRMHQLYIPHNPCVIAEQPRCAPSLIILLQHSPANLCKKDNHVLALCAHANKNTQIFLRCTHFYVSNYYMLHTISTTGQGKLEKKTKYKHIQARTHTNTHRC